MKNNIHKKGFTLIETLVAITVLMIAIAGPLVVASKGLFGATLSKNYMIASYLAQESMEVVKNIKDNNIYNGIDWFTSLILCTKANPCDASAIDGSGANPDITSCIGGPCRIYIEAKGYGHVAGSNPPSAFSRRFYIHDSSSTAACDVIKNECGVTVEVYWNEGQVPYNVIITSEITKTLR